MGGFAYWYYVPHQSDLQTALDGLRKREFEAGRYSPVIRYLEFSEPEFSQQTPGAGHRSIKAAIKASAEEGTRSILDIGTIASTPEHGAAAPLGSERLLELFGTEQPTHQLVESTLSQVLENVQRGMCTYVVIYEKGTPVEICFAGCSYD